MYKPGDATLLRSCEQTKSCSRCGIIKLVAEFSRDKQHSSGYKSNCKSCGALDYQTWRQRNIEDVRRRDRITHYKSTYKLSQEVAEALADNRLGNCEICDIEDLLVVDHNHKTGKVRGFICHNCNQTLGHSKEDTTILGKVIQYIEKYNDI